MKTTARFEIERQKQLAKLFTQSRLVDVWRKLVRQQLRRQAIVDLHDYYDFNSTIYAQADSIIERVLSGQYRAEVPVIFKIEKKLGICRHMMVPLPSDALVFQVLSDGLYGELIKAQPSKLRRLITPGTAMLSSCHTMSPRSRAIPGTSCGRSSRSKSGASARPFLYW